jgi:hypothetical protein
LAPRGGVQEEAVLLLGLRIAFINDLDPICVALVELKTKITRRFIMQQLMISFNNFIGPINAFV